MYLDMEIKFSSPESVNRLFERMTAMKLSSKKMKFVFKKWLQYAQQRGSEDDVEQVKQKATDYVNSS